MRGLIFFPDKTLSFPPWFCFTLCFKEDKELAVAAETPLLVFATVTAEMTPAQSIAFFISFCYYYRYTPSSKARVQSSLFSDVCCRVFEKMCSTITV